MKWMMMMRRGTEMSSSLYMGDVELWADERRQTLMAVG